jgi:DNA-binding beta-propeller fold protein YncE
MRLLAPMCVMLALLAPALAEEKVETVIDGLTNPCGIAVQPETGDLFVADSGAGRIIRVKVGEDGKATQSDVITGFDKDVYGKGPMYDIGPLGLAFLDKNTLIVGGGDQLDVDEVIYVFEIPDAGESALTVENAKTKLGPLGKTDVLAAEGNYYALAITAGAVFATANGDDTKGWIVKANIDGTKFGELERSIATKEAVNVDAPVALTVDKQGNLVVGQMGEINVPNDSLLSFYNPKTGELRLNLETGLFDITGLAYSPKGHLYATDFAWMAEEEGGLFRLDAEGKGQDQTIKPVKIAGLDKPTALAFGNDGAMYITLIGSGEKGGKLVRLAPGL